MTESVSGLYRAGSSRHPRVVVFAALAAGAVLLATTIRADRSTIQFMVAGLALAAVWFTGFAVARGRRPPSMTRRPAVNAGLGFAIGVALFTTFVVVAWIARRLNFLDEPIDDILQQADAYARVWVLALTAVNAVAEELFFRGTMMDVFTNRSAVIATTAAYAVVTSAGGNVALVLAAVVMGAVFAVERRWTRSLVTPIVTHVTWSVLVITAFPRR